MTNRNGKMKQNGGTVNNNKTNKRRRRRNKRGGTKQPNNVLGTRTVQAPLNIGTQSRFGTRLKKDGFTGMANAGMGLFKNDVGIIPFHPMFWSARTNVITQMFAEYKINRLVIHVVPAIGTQTEGTYGVGTLANGVTIPAIQNQRFSNLLELDAIASPVWLKSDYVVDCSVFGWCPVIPKSSSDVPGCVAMVLDNYNGVLFDMISVLVEYDVSLRGVSTGSEYRYGVADTANISVGIGGISSDVTTAPFIGYVLNVAPTPSDSNCDIGEFMTSTPFNAPVTLYQNAIVTHNGVAFRYQDPGDQFIYSVVKLQFA